MGRKGSIVAIVHYDSCKVYVVVGIIVSIWVIRKIYQQLKCPNKCVKLDLIGTLFGAVIVDGEESNKEKAIERKLG